MREAAVIYIVLSVTAILLFMLTRRCDIRIQRCGSEMLKFSIGFTLFKLELTKSISKKQEQKQITESTPEGDANVSFADIFSLIGEMLGVFEKCNITVYRLVIPHRRDFKSFWQYFGYMRIISVIFAYIDSKAEKLVICDNAFILSSDIEDVEFDIEFEFILLDLIISVIRLIANVIKIGKKKEYVGE